MSGIREQVDVCVVGEAMRAAKQRLHVQEWVWRQSFLL